MKGIMYVAILVSFSEENTLSNDLWHKREWMDVVFRVGDREFPAHRIVLVSVQCSVGNCYGYILWTEWGS